MDLTGFAKVLGGAKRLEGSGANRPTNVSRMSGTAVSDSVDGRVLVRLDAQVFSSDDSQYVELTTSDNVREGDSVYVDMVGADGKGKSLMISGAPGSGDRQQGEIDDAATTATRYVTETSDEGIMVHPEDDDTTGWHIGAALELLKAGASVFKVWLDNAATKVRIGSEDESNIVLDQDGIEFCDANGEYASIGVNGTGTVSLSAKNLSSDGYYADFRAWEASNAAHAVVAAGYGENGTIHPAFFDASGGPNGSYARIAGENVEVLPDGGVFSGTHTASADNLAALIACRMYLAGGDMTIAANSGAESTWKWQGATHSGSTDANFPDTNYVVSIGKSGSGLVSGFNNVDFMVTAKTESTVTVYGWNSNAYQVTLHVTCIGFNSRYGSISQ